MSKTAGRKVVGLEMSAELQTFFCRSAEAEVFVFFFTYSRTPSTCCPPPQWPQPRNFCLLAEAEARGVEKN